MNLARAIGFYLGASGGTRTRRSRGCCFLWILLGAAFLFYFMYSMVTVSQQNSAPPTFPTPSSSSVAPGLSG